ncbi:protein kinase [Archangium violaceum]|uniref:serine/threonine-protein kinase n=1 Tax=Archangium violaceum TaxID=83451 RepID=UPI00193C46AD|nr:serine/threonine-protein kinase [Archangium violaceum]QRK07259.1 protein kinase [Archangium violaceum]
MNRVEVSRAEQDSPVLQEMGPYLLQGVLGSGGMGIVYLGVHRETGERVALKTVRVTRASTLASIRREVQLLSRIQHPGIVRILDHGSSGGLPWYAMELLEGRTFNQLIEGYYHQANTRARDAAPKLPARPLLERVLQLCAPLAYLHGCGIVHRDLKPGNIFIRKNGTVVLGDFGVVVEFGGAQGREVLQADHAGMGTLMYMAPEQIRGDLVDARADLYALGCILYECVTGFVPFLGNSPQIVRRRHLQDTPTPPSLLAEEPIPEPLEWLILKLLAKRPEDRLGYAEDVARVLSELGVEADEPDEDRPRPRPYLYRPPFTGRKEAMRELNDLLDEMLFCKGGRVFIGGGSGVGKTRLALELAREALHRDLPVVTCECIPLGLSGTRVDAGMRAPPLHPFRSLLAAVADHCQHGGAKETARLLGPKGKVLVAYEPSLDQLPGQRELPPPPPVPDADAARARIFSALQDVLFAFAEEDPVLLIIDDLQWADEMTLAFLRQLRHEDLVERGVLLLGTYRMEEMGDALREVVSAPGSLHIELGRLDERSIESMARGMLALHSLPRDFDRLVRRSEGNPFFVAEYLRATISEGLLHRDTAGEWRLDERVRTGDSLEELSLPGSIAEIIHRRLRDLDARAQLVAETAAVLGREFDADLLLDTVPLEHTAALEALQTLRVRQILEKAAGGRLRFLHDKLREFTYASITSQRGRQHHRRAAEAIEHRYQQALDFSLYFPSLANHWAKAEVHDQASRYFQLAGDRASATHANAEAILFYRAALTEAHAYLRQERDEPEDWRRALLRVHEHLGDVLALSGRQEEARAAFGDALARLSPDERLHRACIHRKVGKTWETLHQHEDALRAYDEAEAALGPAPEEAGERAPDIADWWKEWVQLQVDRHWTYYWMNRREEMDALVRKLRTVAETRLTPLQRANFFVMVLNTAFRQERYVVQSETLEYGRLAVEAADASGEPSTRVATRFSNAFALLFHGDLDEAERQSLAGLELVEQTGDLTQKSRLLTYLTLIYRKRGDVDRVREYSERSLELARATQMRDYVGAARANHAWVAWREQRVDDAEQEARTALECWSKLSTLYPYPFQWQGLWVLVAVELQRHALARAVEHAHALLDPTQQRLPESLTSDLEAALDAWKQGRQEQAREYLEHAVGSARRQGFL